MSYFMSQQPSQFIFILGKRNHSPVNVDPAACHSEGVKFGRINDREVKMHLGRRKLRKQALAELLQTAFRIINCIEITAFLRIQDFSQPLFLLFREHVGFRSILHDQRQVTAGVGDVRRQRALSVRIEAVRRNSS